ncbi:putative plant lipid transfer protein/Par allergen [Helianthus annuus]|uniref:Non-specific lipid-transfer protein n=2 Tax=Helianthus annuus TaxID=4232 RepID=A0A251S5V8_HELAN|nr:putative plant lipid transfer protein/Par allergen [Helianthus annuus]KAJ0449725.1 putative plant non-specific lipid-transfer protein/Par allergen [Helianthus annuus]KAJ0471422.1 putative plant non-specific lipid-transfer protein/Par allergen [Helianthus annuus]
MHRRLYKYRVSSIMFSHIVTKHITKKHSTMARMMMMKALCMMVAFMVVVAPYAEALSCSDVVSKLSPCINYLQNGGSVPTACCNGVKGLNAAAKSTADKKTACGCMKNAYHSMSGIKANIALGLPKKCGVHIPYKISMSTNCNNIK